MAYTSGFQPGFRERFLGVPGTSREYLYLFLVENGSKVEPNY